MDRLLIALGLLCICAAAGGMLRNHRRTKRTMDTIEQMILSAMDGSFSEARFDESRLSKLETELAHYLSASTVSARNVAAERDKIKALISDISHQTKTPIANLLLHSELLEDSTLTEDQRSSVEAMHAQAEKLRFLIDSLVKLSRLENGILVLSPRREALEPMLRDVFDQMAPRAAEKGLALTVEPAALEAVCDPKWTQEALGNLVDNAIKYTEAGSVALSAAAYEMFVRIDISDTGIGVPEAEQGAIFSRFYRGQAVRDSEGVGIGLYLAREIISMQGGYIKVDSAPGQGATFSVFLPR